jgi:hypothetical protein
MRKRNHKTAFQRNLERLRSMGPHAQFATHSHPAPGKKQGQAISDSSQSEETQDEDEDNETPFVGARPDGDPEEEVPDEEVIVTPGEDSFIVDDGDAIVPVLPAMFSMNTHQDLAHHFKVICQLFVHLAVSPVRTRRKLMESVLRGRSHEFLPFAHVTALMI